jgi:hypothetical protein
MATNNESATTLRYGRIKATIWQNVSEKGSFVSTTFSRIHMAHLPVQILSGAQHATLRSVRLHAFVRQGMLQL